VTFTRFSRFHIPLAILLLFTLIPLGHTADVDPKLRTVTALEQAVKTDPSNADLMLHLAFAYRKVDKLDAAQSAFEKVRALDPHNRDALYMLGLIYEKEHRTADARQAWTDLLAAETNTEKRSIAEKHIHHLDQ